MTNDKRMQYLLTTLSHIKPKVSHILVLSEALLLLTFSHTLYVVPLDFNAKLEHRNHHPDDKNSILTKNENISNNNTHKDDQRK